MNLPWRRNKTGDPTLPQEVQDYYQAEKRGRMGVAGLLAVTTLIATIVLATGIFFGGRWVWRHTVNRPKSTATTATVQTADESSNSTTGNTSHVSQPSTSKTSGGTSSGTGASSSVTQENSANTQTTTSNSVPSATTKSALPSTGPGSVVPVFVAIAIGGVAVAEWRQYRNLNRGTR